MHSPISYEMHAKLLAANLGSSQAFRPSPAFPAAFRTSSTPSFCKSEAERKASPLFCISNVNCASTSQTRTKMEEDYGFSQQQGAMKTSSSSSSPPPPRPPPRECCKGLEKAAKYAWNDAKLVNAYAREGFVLLAREIVRIDKRARQDVALLGSGFLKLDARARQDTEKLDNDAKEKAAHLQRVAMCVTDMAQMQLRIAAEEHWSDGALEADLRLADSRARRRALEDAFIAMQLVKSIHNGVVRTIRQREEGTEEFLADPLTSCRDTENLISSQSYAYDRLSALQEAYLGIASAFAEADGIDNINPDEVEVIVTALLDMDSVDGGSSASLLAECAKSPDIATRQALVNALRNAPSFWALGNAGVGALHRLSQDSNPTVAAAASKALEELQQQWKMDSRDNLIFQPDSSLFNRLNFETDNADEDL